MQPLPPLFTIELFPVLHGHLLDVLRSLSPDDWHRPMPSVRDAGWSVKDVVAHLLDVDLRTIALYRDEYTDPTDRPAITSYESLVGYLNRLNHDWVVAARRLSPAQLLEWHIQTGLQVYAQLEALPPFENARFSVTWAGEDVSANWFHIARQYTEWWHHQQQIRLAVGQTAPLLAPSLYHPVLDTFLRALPHTYRHVAAPPETLVTFVIGDVGRWHLWRNEERWQLVENVANVAPAATVWIDGPMAWRLFTKGVPPAEATRYVHTDGDPALGQPVLTMTAVMA